MKKRFILYLLPVLALISALLSCGCSKPEAPAPGPVMVEVYDDGLYTVDAGRVHTVTEDAGSLTHIVRLHIANRTDEPLVISTLLGAYVECGGERINCVSLHSRESSGTDGLESIDGLIKPDFYADGWAAFPAEEKGNGPLTMSIAVDYCADRWITFELPGPSDVQ